MNNFFYCFIYLFDLNYEIRDEKMQKIQKPKRMNILDKDLLFEGNKIYAPSRCCLLPKEINSGINLHRHDTEFMSRLYHKYKDELPYYLRMELYKLTLDSNKEAA